MIQRFLFRFSFLFFLLFIFLMANEILPLSLPVYDAYMQPLHVIIPWIGKHILHLPYPITQFPYGSFDTTYDYVMLLTVFTLSLAGAAIWTAIQKNDQNIHVLHYWLTAFIRYYCAYSMFAYGLAKLYKLQFANPGPSALIQPLGTYSPMHLAWTFFGFSRTYNYLMGGAEFLSGLLLLFRRTTRLGAMLMLVVMVNVMAVNYGYDVCLKIMSTALAAMALFLLWQDRRRLIQFFILNRITMPESEWRPSFRSKWMEHARWVLKYGFTLFILYDINHDIFTFKDGYSDDRKLSAFHGVFNVQAFIRNGDTLAPLLTDTTRWRRLVVQDFAGGLYASVKAMSDSGTSWQITPDTAAHRLMMIRRIDTTVKYPFHYTFLGKDSLHLVGKWKKDTVDIMLKKYDPNKFVLVNRGFHWINEEPFIW